VSDKQTSIHRGGHQETIMLEKIAFKSIRVIVAVSATIFATGASAQDVDAKALLGANECGNCGFR
jgi:hypothetical protein